MNAPRSVNIADDLDRNGVVDSYRPTRKSLQVVRAVCGFEGSRATQIVAPYGAGKSIAALAGVTLLVGEPDKARRLRRRIASVDRAFADEFGAITGASIVVLLHGTCPDLATTLCRQLNLPPPLKTG